MAIQILGDGLKIEPVEAGDIRPRGVEQGCCHHGNTFDPAAWLSALVAIGGGYALAAGRKLYLVVDDCDTYDLAPIVGQIIAQPDRVESIRTAIERRQIGETA